MRFTAVVRKGEKQYVALCPEVDVVSQGHTVKESLENLKEAVELFLEETNHKSGGEVSIARFEVENVKAPSSIRTQTY